MGDPARPLNKPRTRTSDGPYVDFEAVLGGLASVPEAGLEALVPPGPVAVVVPHADDEALGCGGLLARLARRGTPVTALFVTDGTGSHPNSRTHPAPVLQALREDEARRALDALGVGAGAARFLRLPDGALPHPGDPGFRDAAEVLKRALEAARPATVLAPWRRDPHRDHRAAWAYTDAALKNAPGVKRLEYPIWAWVRAAAPDVPRPGEAHAWRLDIGAVQAVKRAAVRAHASQTTPLIADDPLGFTLQPAVLKMFDRPWEVYFEPTAP